MSRVALAHQVLIYRSAGWTYDRIAAELGISRSYANDLALDPSGALGRARKNSYGGTCEVCGKRTDGGNGPAAAPKLCNRCAREKQRSARRWTRDEIVRVMREFAAVVGRPPSAIDYHGLAPSQITRLSNTRRRELHLIKALGLEMPSPTVIRREFGSYQLAYDAAGLEKPPTGTPGHREPRKPQSHCKRGHELADPNLYYDPAGQRYCRECLRIRGRARRVRERAVMS